MQLGMIGLGRMGDNMVRRLHHDGHDCVVHDVAEAPIADASRYDSLRAEVIHD